MICEIEFLFQAYHSYRIARLSKNRNLGLDDIDLRILRHLQDKPEAPATEIADSVGLSHTPCWRRIKRMEELGIIKGRAMILDADMLGLPINIFAEIKIKNHDEKTVSAFEQAVSDHAEIVECFSMSGENDFLMRVVARSIADYEVFLKRVLLHLPGVASVNSRFALNALKVTTNLPL